MTKKTKLYILPIAALLAFASAPRQAISQTGTDPKPTNPVPPPKPPTPPVPPANPNGVSMSELVATVLRVYGLS